MAKTSRGSKAKEWEERELGTSPPISFFPRHIIQTPATASAPVFENRLSGIPFYCNEESRHSKGRVVSLW
jgi:hypothetical protein